MQFRFTPWELKIWSCIHLGIHKELEELKWFPNGPVQSALCFLPLKCDQSQYDTHRHLWKRKYPKLHLNSIHLSAYLYIYALAILQSK